MYQFDNRFAFTAWIYHEYMQACSYIVREREEKLNVHYPKDIGMDGKIELMADTGSRQS
jgi:hypothetical protein